MSKLLIISGISIDNLEREKFRARSFIKLDVY